MTSSSTGSSPVPPVLRGLRVRLRPARFSDIPDLVRLRNAVREAFFSTQAVDEAMTRQWLADSQARGELNWIIESEERVIGTVSAIPGVNGTEVGRIITDPAMQRRGYMEEALRVVLPYLAANCPLPIFLEVRATNLPAIRLYEKLGFSVTRFRMDWNDSAL